GGGFDAGDVVAVRRGGRDDLGIEPLGVGRGERLVEPGWHGCASGEDGQQAGEQALHPLQHSDGDAPVAGPWRRAPPDGGLPGEREPYGSAVRLPLARRRRDRFSGGDDCAAGATGGKRQAIVAAGGGVPILPAVKVYLNGEILPAHQARIGVFDRGFLFGDGVYEGIRAFDGCLISPRRHTERFAAGLREARIDWDAADLEAMSQRLLAASGLRDAFIYWQVTRGAPTEGMPVRSRVARGLTPTVFGYVSKLPALTDYPEPPR